jgi:fermentation-respiration switch protein FrsA (DUF1100 family)
MSYSYFNSKGSVPFAAETALFWQDWGFSLGDIEIKSPLTIWHGEKDINVPVEHAKYACEKIAGV